MQDFTVTSKNQHNNFTRHAAAKIIRFIFISRPMAKIGVGKLFVGGATYDASLYSFYNSFNGFVAC